MATSVVSAKPKAAWMVHSLKVRQEREQSNEPSSYRSEVIEVTATAQISLPSAQPYIDPAKPAKKPLPAEKKSDDLEAAFNELKVDETQESTEIPPEPILAEGSHSVSLKAFSRLKENRPNGITTTKASSNLIPNYLDLDKYEKYNPTVSRPSRDRFARPEPRRLRSSSPETQKEVNQSSENDDDGRKTSTGFFKRTISSLSTDSNENWETMDFDEAKVSKRPRLADPCVIIDDDGKERINYQYVKQYKARLEVPGQRRRIHQEMDRDLEYYFQKGPRTSRAESRRDCNSSATHRAEYKDGKISVIMERRDDSRETDKKERSRGLSNRRRNEENVH